MATRRLGFAAPAVHRLASVVCPDRRRPGGADRRHALIRHPARVFSRSRGLRACARRAAWASAANLSPGDRPVGRRHHRTGGRGRSRFGRRVGAGGRAVALHRRRGAVRVRLQPRAAGRAASRRLLVRSFVGAFPVLTAYYAQTGRISIGSVAAAAAAYALAFGQRALSTPARQLRRKTRSVTGTLTRSDGSEQALDEPALLHPLESALRAFSWGVVLLGLGLVATKLLG